MRTHKLIKEFQNIPGVGTILAKDFIELGFKSVSDLQGADPEKMYDTICHLRGEHIDRCVLYVYRCAVYFASEPDPKPDLLKWWNWKDQK